MIEISVSALKEVGYLLNKILIPSMSLLASDMAGAVVDHVLIGLSQSRDFAMMVETNFGEEPDQDLAIKGHSFLLPGPGTLNTFLSDVRGGV
jgi:chemotaxis protein CheC